MLRVRVLGELALERDGVALELPAGRPARTLLAALALDHRLHARSVLAAQLWPDVLDESSRTSLRGALAALRRTLEPGADAVLVASREHIGLHADVWIDAAVFHDHVAAGRLADAAALWRDPPLPGLDDEWVLAAREGLVEAMITTLGTLADAADAAGDAAEAIAITRRLVTLEPLGEAGQRALIERLARTGDRPAALAAYGRYADRLRNELRVAPSAQTRALIEELRTGDPPALHHTPRPVAPTRPPGTVTLLFTDLVGSTELLSRLGDDEAERLRRVHFSLLRDVAIDHAGEEVKSLGDGLMVAFGSCVDAVGCAVGIQQAVQRHNRRTTGVSLHVRTGLEVGEPIRHEDDYFGTPVVVAKRLCDRATGGQILVADLVRRLVGSRGNFTFRPVGDLELKGLTDKVTTWEVAWAPTSTKARPLPSALTREHGSLIGRVDELAVLDEAWSTVRAGRLAVVSVAGGPGIGKTRTVTEFCRQAHADGATVLFGGCHEDTGVPYEPFIEALGAYVGGGPADELRRQLGTRRRALAKLVPELRLEGDAEADGAGDEGERHMLFEAAATLVREAAATRPVVLILDDVHWADDASLLLFRHLVRAADDVPLLVLLTFRDTEAREGDPLSAALAQLRRARKLTAVTLAGLDTAAVTALARERGSALGDETLRAVAEQTEGNPFFVEELLREVGADGRLSVPDSVKDLLNRRLRGLDEPVRRTLAAAAVLGREFDVAVLERVAESTSEAIVDDLEAALDEHVLVDVPDAVGRYAFAHALIRETIYEQLSAARRPGLHMRAGAALETCDAVRLDERAGQLALHFARGGDDARSFHHELVAANVARRVHADASAIDHLDAALATAGRLGLSPVTDERVRRLLLERGWLRWTAGDDASVADYGHALQAARTAGDRRLEAEALDCLAYAEKQFDVVRSTARHDEALAIAAELDDASLEVRILSRTALTRANNLDFAGAAQASARAGELAEQTGDERDRALAVDALKLTALQTGDLAALEAACAQLEGAQRRRGELWYLQWTLLESAFVPLAGAHWDRATERLSEALAFNRRVGDRRSRPMMHEALCWLHRSRGDLGAALTEGRSAVELTLEASSTAFGAWTCATLGWTLLDLRAADAAVEVLERGLQDAVMLGARFRVAGHLAWACSLRGDVAGAERAVQVAEEAYDQLRVRDGEAFVLGFGAAAALARARLALGDPERAATLLTPLRTVAARSGWQEATAQLSLVLGLCHESLGAGDAARDELRVALDVSDRHGLPGTGWEALAALARLGPVGEAAELRTASVAVVQRLAAGVQDAALAAGLVRAAAQS